MEIFSSPTNSGITYAAIVEAVDAKHGERLDFDPYHWEYRPLCSMNEFRFVEPKV